MQSQLSPDCNHSSSGVCSRCVLQKAFNLTSEEAKHGSNPRLLSFNSLFSLNSASAEYQSNDVAVISQPSLNSSSTILAVPSQMKDTVAFSIGSRTTEEDTASVDSAAFRGVSENGLADDIHYFEEAHFSEASCSTESLNFEYLREEVEEVRCGSANLRTLSVCQEEDVKSTELKPGVNMLNSKDFIGKGNCFGGQSLLLRLFESNLFDVVIAVQYLFRSRESGVLNYLGTRLFDFPSQSVDFYLPQLINLYINVKEVAGVLQPYIIKRCSESVEFSLECCWLLDAYGADVAKAFKQKPQGFYLRKLIMSEFRQDTEARENLSNSSSSFRQRTESNLQHARSRSEATMYESSQMGNGANTDNCIRRSESALNTAYSDVSGDLTSGRAFDSGCTCFDENEAENDMIEGQCLTEKQCTCGAERIRPQQEFVKALMDIGERLKLIGSKEDRSRHLVNELVMINLNLPARVWLPLYSDSVKHIVLRIPHFAGCVLNSKDKAPYCLYVEVLEVEDVRLAAVPHRISDIEAIFQRRQLESASDMLDATHLCLHPSQSEGEMMTDSLPDFPPKSPSANILNDHSGDIRRKFSNWVRKPKIQLRNTPDDPSAATMSEPWEEKVKRIRESSPYGRNTGWKLLPVIIKTGDDLRQELLAYQLLTTLKNIWAEEKVPLYIRPYKIVVCSRHSGMIEPIVNASSLHQIKKNLSINAAENKSKRPVPPTLLTHFLNIYGPAHSEAFSVAQQNFVHSCAGYSLACYFLQVKDRHNGNILLDGDGHLIHIDFGFFLSASPKNLGFESSPFKLTQEIIDVMGGFGSDMFEYYKILLLKGLLAARKYNERLVNIIEIMSAGSQLPCFRGGPSAIRALRERFHMSYTEEQLQALVETLVEQSRDSLTTRLYDSFQYYTNGIL